MTDIETMQSEYIGNLKALLKESVELLKESYNYICVGITPTIGIENAIDSFIEKVKPYDD